MSTAFEYTTLASATESLLKERGSKFFGYAYPVSNQTDIKKHLEILANQYPDATHICYAWVLGINGDEHRANDDGEPNNSAGQPILREIKSAGLTYILVAVVRYYGGKKLGVSGLIEAYGGAAKEALESGSQVTKELQKICWLKHLGAKDYQVYEYANRLRYTIVNPPSIAGGFFEISVPLQAYEPLVNSFESLPNFELTDDATRF